MYGLTRRFWYDDFIVEKMVVPVNDIIIIVSLSTTPGITVNDKNVSCSKW